MKQNTIYVCKCEKCCHYTRYRIVSSILKIPLIIDDEDRGLICTHIIRDARKVENARHYPIADAREVEVGEIDKIM
ncbi:hypothetical protein VNO78_10627 [Psophocarpus tetragonolobus]|uniref:Uncharacterized protein n=1 Tax=Psophocarpus tetragonolobus TaxID=3891 RepID=A0AAN9XMW9_PSOTE